MSFDFTTLENGLRIIGERMPEARSVALGIWVGTGSEYEREEEAGVSHMIEHMAFKGTQKRSQRQISEEMDIEGGQLNAYTEKESTCFYTVVVKDRVQPAVDLLCDMVIHSRFDESDLNREKDVVLEEIAMDDDTPDELVGEILMQAHYGNQCVARPILGTRHSVRKMTRKTLFSYYLEQYRPQNCVFSIAGNYDWKQMVDLIRQSTEDWERTETRAHLPETRLTEPGIAVREKDTEQIHMSLGFPGLKIGHDRSYELAIISSVYGGADSSRLFQKIREESGLAYSVYSSTNAYTDTGMLTVYAGVRPERAVQVYDMILEETRKLREEGMTRTEFERNREQIRAEMILSSESTTSHNHANGRRMLLLNQTATIDELIAKLESVEYERTNALMNELLSAKCSLALVGKQAEKFADRMKR